MLLKSQWVNSVPPYVRKLHFMYEVIRTSSKYHGSIYRTSKKCRGTLRVVHKAERNSPTVKILRVFATEMAKVHSINHYCLPSVPIDSDCIHLWDKSVPCALYKIFPLNDCQCCVRSGPIKRPYFVIHQWKICVISSLLYIAKGNFAANNLSSAMALQNVLFYRYILIKLDDFEYNIKLICFR